MERYYYFSVIVQLLPAFMLTLFGLWIEPLFLTLNVAVLSTVVERIKKQEPEQSEQA